MVDIARRWVAPIVREWHEQGSAYEIVRLLTAPARRGLVRLTVEHPENLPTHGPVIVVANHRSFFDSVLLMFALPRPVSVLGKAEYTDQRITNWLFCGAGISRSGAKIPAISSGRSRKLMTSSIAVR